MKKSERAIIVKKILDKTYPDTPVPLNHKDNFTLLIAVLLSAQCTDERVNQITNKKYYMETVTLSFWPKNSKQNFHIDKTRMETDYTSITYLNQNFQGGKTLVFEDANHMMTCSPKTGRLLCFDGKKHYHGVTPIESQDRYTLNIWYSLYSDSQINWKSNVC